VAKKEERNNKEEKKGGSLLVLILLVVQVITLAAVGGLFYMVLKRPAVAVVPGDTAVKGKAREAGKTAVMVNLKPFVVNLADEGGRRYLKASIDLEVGSKGVASEIDKNLPAIRNAIIMILSSKSFADIFDRAGKDRLREEIKYALNSKLTKGEVRQVYFTEFVVQ